MLPGGVKSLKNRCVAALIFRYPLWPRAWCPRDDARHIRVPAGAALRGTRSANVSPFIIPGGIILPVFGTTARMRQRILHKSCNRTPYLAACIVHARWCMAHPCAPVFNPTDAKVGTPQNYFVINGDHYTDPNNSALCTQYSNAGSGRRTSVVIPASHP